MTECESNLYIHPAMLTCVPPPPPPPSSLCQPPRSDGAPVGELQVLEELGRDEVQEPASSPSFLTDPSPPPLVRRSERAAGTLSPSVERLKAAGTPPPPESGRRRPMCTEAPSQITASFLDVVFIQWRTGCRLSAPSPVKYSSSAKLCVALAAHLTICTIQCNSHEEPAL